MISRDDLFFRDHCIFRTKSALPEMTSSNELVFLEITAFLGRKLHYQGMTSSDDLCLLEINLKSRTKIGLENTQFYDLVLACQLHD